MFIIYIVMMSVKEQVSLILSFGLDHKAQTGHEWACLSLQKLWHNTAIVLHMTVRI